MLGKTAIEVTDSPGFVSNRVLLPMINEAIYCLQEGVGTPEAIDENLQRIHDLYARTEREGVGGDELRQAKNKVRSRLVLAGERPRGRLFMVGGDWITRREYRSVSEELDILEAVSLEEANQVLRTYPLTKNTTMTIGPRTDVRPPK